jgi:hypothetical protein
LPYTLFQEERNKNLIPKQSELLIAPTKYQYWTVVRVEDYHLKDVTKSSSAVLNSPKT